MVLYCKAGPDGKSIGDCPFCHAIRMVLEEKGLEYTLVPATQETKPNWLIESYDGKLPALRHQKECYVESNVIVAYLEFFFPSPLKDGEGVHEEAAAALFPAVAKYLKHTPDGNDQDAELLQNLETVLQDLQSHLEGKTFWCGDDFSVQDCRLAPQLYILQTCLKAFKSNALDIAKTFPAVQAYTEALVARPSFQATLCPESVVEWGWTNARQ
jgi:glutathione S-transferase